MRELLVLARARLGARASTLKTREELEAALQEPVPAEVEPPPPAEVVHPPPPVAPAPIVVRDFFIRQF